MVKKNSLICLNSLDFIKNVSLIKLRKLILDIVYEFNILETDI